MSEKRYVLDSSVLVSAINSNDVNHVSCYSFIKNEETASWVIPYIAYFEFQATQSRLRKEGKRAIREIYLGNAEKYELNEIFIKQCSEMDLFNKLDSLRGADLIFACVAAVEGIPLVTKDEGFRKVEHEISVIYPESNSDGQYILKGIP